MWSASNIFPPLIDHCAWCESRTLNWSLGFVEWPMINLCGFIVIQFTNPATTYHGWWFYHQLKISHRLLINPSSITLQQTIGAFLIVAADYPTIYWFRFCSMMIVSLTTMTWCPMIYYCCSMNVVSMIVLMMRMMSVMMMIWIDCYHGWSFNNVVLIVLPSTVTILYRFHCDSCLWYPGIQTIYEWWANPYCSTSFFTWLHNHVNHKSCS